MTTTPDHVDLAWLAFAYATDALDADTSDAFEHRLDDDQAAREALAEAVLLVGLVQSAAIATRNRNRRLHRTYAVAATGFLSAAALALVSAPRLFAPAAVTTATAPANVALTWSELRHRENPGLGRDDLQTWLTEPPAPVSAPAPAEVDPNDPADPFPHWLLEAAALPAPDEGQGS